MARGSSITIVNQTSGANTAQSVVCNCGSSYGILAVMGAYSAVPAAHAITIVDDVGRSIIQPPGNGNGIVSAWIFLVFDGGYPSQQIGGFMANTFAQLLLTNAYTNPYRPQTLTIGIAAAGAGVTSTVQVFGYSSGF